MKLLYTHPNPFIVHNAKCIIEQSSIKVMLKNEMTAGAVGELPPIDNWLELWVLEEMHYERALAMLSDFNQPEKSHWYCSNCSENNGGAFEWCWSCGEERC